MDRKRKVRNKDIALLGNVFAVMQEIRAIEERREWQKARMTNIAHHLSFTGGGRGGEPHGLDSAYAILSDIENEHHEKVRQYRQALQRAENIINGIENLRMRAMVMMLYVEELPAKEVRERLNMSRRHFDAAVAMVEQAENMRSIRWHDADETHERGN